MANLSNAQKHQIRNLVFDTIEPAFYEDFNFTSSIQAEEAKQLLIKELQKMIFNPKDFDD